MKNLTPFQEITFDNMPQAVAKVYNEVFLIRNQLQEIKQNFKPKEPIEWLTRNEVAELLKCDLSTLHNWVKKGKLTPYGIGNRIYFKRSEIENAIVYLGKKKGANNE